MPHYVYIGGFKKVIPDLPILILIRGHPCSGKTTLAKELLTRYLVAVYIVKDDIHEPFAPGDRESDFYRIHVRKQGYTAMDKIAERNLSLGNSVVLDSPFNDLDQTGPNGEEAPKYNFMRIAERNRARLKIIQCHVPYDVLRQRLIARGESRDQSKIVDDEAWEKYQAIITNFEHLTGLDVRIVDTTQPLVNQQWDKIIRWLSA